MKRIIGIDPGLANTGFGILDVDGSRYIYRHHGVISTRSSGGVGERLLLIYDSLVEIIEKFSPVEAGVESLYFARNITSAIPVAQARGIVLLALEQAHVHAAEYPPQAIKQAIVGSGRAEKRQVQELVSVLLGLSEIPRPDHAADALAAAICHANTMQVVNALTRKQRGNGPL
ncbi:MAG TPA: crossover junction endodeoxyribonuclease RuvC [Spirochaetia bacterium]|nr:crossover junction endodeoxyribonuclease RuvC [Spirochaetia bacterium]